MDNKTIVNEMIKVFKELDTDVYVCINQLYYAAMNRLHAEEFDCTCSAVVMNMFHKERIAQKIRIKREKHGYLGEVGIPQNVDKFAKCRKKHE